MAGSPFVKIDRLFDKVMAARAREAYKKDRLISCGIVEVLPAGDGFQADRLPKKTSLGREPVCCRKMGQAER